MRFPTSVSPWECAHRKWVHLLGAFLCCLRCYMTAQSLTSLIPTRETSVPLAPPAASPSPQPQAGANYPAGEIRRPRVPDTCTRQDHFCDGSHSLARAVCPLQLPDLAWLRQTSLTWRPGCPQFSSDPQPALTQAWTVGLLAEGSAVSEPYQPGAEGEELA